MKIIKAHHLQLLSNEKKITTQKKQKVSTGIKPKYFPKKQARVGQNKSFKA
jgi:hypothetical protein